MKDIPLTRESQYFVSLEKKKKKSAHKQHKFTALCSTNDKLTVMTKYFTYDSEKLFNRTGNFFPPNNNSRDSAYGFLWRACEHNSVICYEKLKVNFTPN